MPSPTAQLTRTRDDLGGSVESFDLAASRLGFVAQRVLPFMDVAEMSGQFGTIPLAELLKNSDDLRAMGGGYSRGNWQFTPDTWSCTERGHEEPVDDRARRVYASWFDAERIATQRAVDTVLRNAEKRVAALIFNTGTWTGSTLTTAITNEWDDFANATPVADVQNASVRVFNGIGMYANALICNKNVYNNLRQCDQVVEAVHSYGAGQSAMIGKITEQILASALGLDFVFVAGGAKNSANEGQTATPAVVWSGEYAMVCRVAVTDDVAEPCIGRTFHYIEDGSSPECTVETYRDETKRSDIVRARFDVHEKVIMAAAGHLLSNVTT